MDESDFESVSTSEMPPAMRLKRWNDFISDTFAVMRVQPEDCSDFNATLSRIRIGSLGFIWYSTTASSGLVDVGRDGGWSAPIGEAFLLAVQERGRSVGDYLGRQIVTDPGDMVLLDTARSWRIESHEPISTVAIKIPAERLLNQVRDPEVICGRPLQAGHPHVALAGSLILRIKDAIEADPLADWSAYESVLTDIVGIALSRSAEAPAGPAVAGRLRRQVCALIERHLDDPDLGSEMIADALDVNRRRVQRIFSEMGCTPRSYIQERRLTMAAEMLKRPEFACQSITEIAFAVGFGDLSHFVRSFRSRWDASPREFRAGQGTSD